MRTRRALSTLALSALVAALLVAGPVTRAAATPVATDAASYTAYGRVFPDPHGCLPPQAPEVSPWAKGNVCAGQFLQWQQVLDGIAFLQEQFPGYVQLINLREQYGDLPALAQESLQSAGLPSEDLGRLKRDLYVIKVTHTASPVPEAERQHFAYSLSIHGIERAGIEGGIRAVEDLVSWAACENGDGNGSPVCAAEGPFPKRILEPTGSGPTAGRVLDEAVIYFTLSNPDGWRRGEWSEGGAFFQRYNGNGMDMNRDWPAIGYTRAAYTPWSEPETRGYGKFLKQIRESTAAGRFAGAIDLHGMVTAEAFSYTLLGAGQRDYRKNAITVDTAIRTFQDAEQRLAWSPMIAPTTGLSEDGQCPQHGSEVGILVEEAYAQVCSDQWGTVWDTIDYQVTGSFGDWMDSPIGLDAVGIDNEMLMSHLAPNNVFDPGLEQAHIDGNKGLIYAQIASLMETEEVTYEPGGHIGYVYDPERVADDGGEPAEPPSANLPTQPDLELTEVAGQGVEFDVKSPADGYVNGGLAIEATYTNARGISGGTGLAVTETPLILDYCGDPDGTGGHPGDTGCHEVARYFNQSAIYLQGGARIDLNSPQPGIYRIRPDSARAGITRYDVSFSRDRAYPVPEQEPYDASNMDFFAELNTYAPPGSELEAVTVDQVLADPSTLDRFDSLVVADEPMPGYVAPEDRREPIPAEPAGAPQDGESATVTPVPNPSAPDAVHEFTVQDGFDNDRMTVAASWPVVSDYDLFVEQRVDGEWVPRGEATNFVNAGESVTVSQPEPGQWRAVVENFAAAPQPVEVRVSFEALGEPGQQAVTTQYTTAQYDAYLAALRDWASGGGNVVLTDGGLAALPGLVDGVSPKDVHGGVFYAGWMDFDPDGGAGGDDATYDHPLAQGVAKPGAAEGDATVDDVTFDNRHQTFEPVPLGYLVGGPDDCSSGCDAPNWVVAQGPWEQAGGSTVGRTLIRPGPGGGPGTIGTSLGEVPVGEGVVRIVGALLPEPTEANYHPFGLADYALTYTGYELFENVTTYDNPNRQDPAGPQPGVALDCGDCAVEVVAGESASQDVTVANTGNVPDAYDLTASAPDGWDASIEPAAVSLEPGASTTATLTVQPPNREQKGTYEVVVTASSQGHPGVSTQQPVTVTVDKGQGGPPEQAGQRPEVRGAMQPARTTGGLHPALLLGAVLLLGVLVPGLRRRRR